MTSLFLGSYHLIKKKFNGPKSLLSFLNLNLNVHLKKGERPAAWE